MINIIIKLYRIGLGLLDLPTGLGDLDLDLPTGLGLLDLPTGLGDLDLDLPTGVR